MINSRLGVVGVGAEGNPVLSATKKFIEDFEKKIDSLIATRPAHEGLTPPAQKLESLHREGRVVDPEARLEKAPKLPKKKP